VNDTLAPEKTPSCLIKLSSAAALFDVPPEYLQSLVDAGLLKVVAVGRYKRLQFDEVTRAMREGLTIDGLPIR
jgi:hypothetical protein